MFCLHAVVAVRSFADAILFVYVWYAAFAIGTLQIRVVVVWHASLAIRALQMQFCYLGFAEFVWYAAFAFAAFGYDSVFMLLNFFGILPLSVWLCGCVSVCYCFVVTLFSVLFLPLRTCDSVVVPPN